MVVCLIADLMIKRLEANDVEETESCCYYSNFRLILFKEEKMLYLNEKVYIVDGKTNGAIYDLNKGNLYHISKEAKAFLHKVCSEEFIPTFNEQQYIDYLIAEEILTETETKEHSIEELIEPFEIGFVWIEVTNICNLRCIHCYDEAGCGKGDVMSYSDFCHIIDELTINHISKVQLIGGEPFVLGEDLITYLEYMKGKFEYIEIFTNGTLIKEKWITYLKENNIHIALSVYSYQESEHNKVTQSNSWKKTNDTIQKLKENGIPYKVKNVIIKGIDIGEKNTDLYSLSYKKDIIRLTGRASLKLVSKDMLKRKLITEKSFSDKLSLSLVKRCVSGHNCFNRRLYFAVDSKVYPCVMERRLCHGNIKGKHLTDILSDEIRKLDKNKIEVCQDCEFRYCCFDCRPDSNGKGIYDKTWYCTYNPYTGVWEDIDRFSDNLE